MSSLLTMIIAISTGILAGRALANFIGSITCFYNVRKNLLVTYEIASTSDKLNLFLKVYFNRTYLLSDFKKTYQKMCFLDKYFTNQEFLNELTPARIFRFWPLPLFMCLISGYFGLTALSIGLATLTASLQALDCLWCRVASQNINYILNLYGIEVDYDDMEPPDGYGH